MPELTMGTNTPWDFKKEEDVREYLKNLNTEYTFQCYGEKDPDGCHRLGNYYEAVSKDLEKAAKIYKMNCDENNHGRSCFGVGRYYLLGTAGLQKNEEKAYEAFKRGCDSKNPDGAACDNAGTMCTINKKFYNIPLAAQLHEKGCSVKDGKACLHGAALYLAGKDIERNMEKALELSKQACHRGEAKGCYNAATIYRIGDGVPKDKEMFEIYKKKFLETANPDSITFS